MPTRRDSYRVCAYWGLWQWAVYTVLLIESSHLGDVTTRRTNKAAHLEHNNG